MQTPGADRGSTLDQQTVERVLEGITGLGRVVVVPTTASTSTDLLQGVAAESAGWPDRSVLVADHQAAGRGRAGRTWITPPGTAVTVSVLLRPAVALNRFGWVPLLAGLAVVRALAEVTGGEAAAVLKWPNDVLLPAPDGAEETGWGRYRKVAGVLGDLVVTPAGPAVVVGIGVNVDQRADELPVPSATSLRVAQGEPVPGRVEVLGAVVRSVLDLDTRWRASSGDAWAAGLGAECTAACATLGGAVQVELPGGGLLEGTATALTADGALEVTDAAGRTSTVLAGDVLHLRSGPGRVF